jgi:hypothetical protein
MGLAAQSIRNDIHLPRMVVNLQIIVLDQLQPSFLVHVQIRLGKDVLQALVVGIDVDHIPKQIMSPCSQGKDDGRQLKIMSWIMLFMTSELS